MVRLKCFKNFFILWIFDCVVAWLPKLFILLFQVEKKNGDITCLFPVCSFPAKNFIQKLRAKKFYFWLRHTNRFKFSQTKHPTKNFPRKWRGRNFLQICRKMFQKGLRMTIVICCSSSIKIFVKSSKFRLSQRWRKQLVNMKGFLSLKTKNQT